jgi:hypothetical protein
MSTAVHRSPNNFGELTPYLTHRWKRRGHYYVAHIVERLTIWYWSKTVQSGIAIEENARRVHCTVHCTPYLFFHGAWLVYAAKQLEYPVCTEYPCISTATQNINSDHSTAPSPFPTSNPCYKNAAILIISIWVDHRHLLRVRWHGTTSCQACWVIETNEMK